MATITIRNLDDDVQRRLRVRAASHERSMEAEAREILTSAVAEPRLVVDWIAAVQEIGVEVRLPARHTPRSVDLP